LITKDQDCEFNGLNRFLFIEGSFY
jgi:hypothetical protein